MGTIVKTTITVPGDVLLDVDGAAKQLGISRSEFFTRAVIALLAACPNDGITASYDCAFSEAEADEGLVVARRRLARAAIRRIEWR